MASAALLTTVLTSSSLAARIAGRDMTAALNPQGRSRVLLLDEFDSSARPSGIIYDPFTVTEADRIPPLIQFSASPGSRKDPQPLEVLLNARFGLPAGDYQMEIGDVPEKVSGIVALQIGRTGPPMRQWQADLQPGQPWQAAFPLPLDAEFVAFRHSPPLKAARRLLVRPLRIVDAPRRLPPLPVFASGRSGPATIFFHDELTYPEAKGFWINGRASTSITVAPDRPAESLTLRVNSGPRPNTLVLETSTWRTQLDLSADEVREAVIPLAGPFRPIRLRLTTSSGFVPAEVFSGSGDRRLLGCWVEIAG
jgi:hypothetical protein